MRRLSVIRVLLERDHPVSESETWALLEIAEAAEELVRHWDIEGTIPDTGQPLSDALNKLEYEAAQ